MSETATHSERYGVPVPDHLTHDEAEMWVEGYKAGKADCAAVVRIINAMDYVDADEERVVDGRCWVCIDGSAWVDADDVAVLFGLLENAGTPPAQPEG